MTQIITTSSTTVGTNIVAASAGEYIFVAEGVTRASTGGNGLAANLGGIDTVILGTVTASGTGVSFSNVAGDDGNFNIFVGASGSIMGVGTGIRLEDANNSLTNEGTIRGGSTGVRSLGDNFQFINTGTISATDGRALVSDGMGSDLVNYGLISTTGIGAVTVEFFTDNGDLAPTLTNYGTITHSDPSGSAIRGDFDGTDEVRNFGIVNGAVAQVGGDDLLINAGTINGDVSIGSGLDRVENSGDIFGSVFLDDDVDVYRGDGDSTVSGVVLGGFGDDRMFGGQNADRLYGDEDNDKVRGRDGDDELFGGSGEDNIKGNDGDDVIEGNQDNDELYGGRGDDEISGGSGNDTITGGTGNDILSGNSGADTFVFTRRSGEDEITDFKNNTDKLDLSAFDVSSRQDLTDAGAIIANGAGSIIDLTKLGGDGVIYIEDMSVNQWGNSDFVF